MKIALFNKSIKTTLPEYATPGSVGLDLVATSKTWVERTYSVEKQRYVGGYWLYGTNICAEIPDEFFGLLVPKSSSRDYSLILSNSVGVDDPDYRGEIMFSYTRDQSHSNTYRAEYNIGDEVGQLVILPRIQLGVELVDKSELSETQRGEGGHGSTSEKADEVVDQIPLTPVENAVQLILENSAPSVETPETPETPAVPEPEQPLSENTETFVDQDFAFTASVDPLDANLANPDAVTVQPVPTEELPVSTESADKGPEIPVDAPVPVETPAPAPAPEPIPVPEPVKAVVKAAAKPVKVKAEKAPTVPLVAPEPVAVTTVAKVDIEDTQDPA